MLELDLNILKPQYDILSRDVLEEITFQVKYIYSLKSFFLKMRKDRLYTWKFNEKILDDFFYSLESYFYITKFILIFFLSEDFHCSRYSKDNVSIQYLFSAGSLYCFSFTYEFNVFYLYRLSI